MNGSATWGQATNGDELAALLGAGEEPATSSLQVPVAATPELEGGAVASAPAESGPPRWGIGLLALWVGTLQLALDLGQQRDWFSSPLITTLVVLSGGGLVAFLIDERVLAALA